MCWPAGLLLPTVLARSSWSLEDIQYPYLTEARELPTPTTTTLQKLFGLMSFTLSPTTNSN
jgi:hypothetical protein